MGSTTLTAAGTIERWVIGADKKPKFTIRDKTDSTDIALSVFSGYGIIVFDPEGLEAGRYGYNIAGYSPIEVSNIDAFTFQVVLDKSINTKAGLWKYRIHVVWDDTDFSDDNYEAFNDIREPLYFSVAL